MRNNQRIHDEKERTINIMRNNQRIQLGILKLKSILSQAAAPLNTKERGTAGANNNKKARVLQYYILYSSLKRTRKRTRTLKKKALKRSYCSVQFFTIYFTLLRHDKLLADLPFS